MVFGKEGWLNTILPKANLQAVNFFDCGEAGPGRTDMINYTGCTIISAGE